MVEAKRRTPASILQRLSGESLVMAMDEAKKESHKSCKKNLVNGSEDREGEKIGSLELAENVGVFSGDARGLQHRYPEGEQVADLEVLQRGIQGTVQTRL